MEKRILLAFILSLIAITVWQLLFPPPAPPEKPETADEQTAGENPGPVAPKDGTANPAPGPTRPAAPGEPVRDGEPTVVSDEPIVLRSDHLHLGFSRIGAALVDGRLLDHRQTVDSPAGDEGAFRFVRRFEGGPLALGLQDERRRDGWLDAAVWDTDGPAEDGRSVTFRLPVVEGEQRYVLTKTFRFSEEGPERLEIVVRMERVAGTGTLSKDFSLTTSAGVFPAKLVGAQVARPHSVYGIGKGDNRTVERVAFDDDAFSDGSDVKVLGRASFVADMAIYFGTYLRYVDGGALIGGEIRRIETSTGDEKPSDAELDRIGPDRTVSALAVNLSVSEIESAQESRFDYYLGPKDHRRIKANYPEGEAREAYLEVADEELTANGFCCPIGPLNGVITLISKAVIAALDLFHGLFGNMGVAIIILTLCVRTLMFPITRKSQVAMHHHSQKMAKIKPKLDALKEKYGNDKQAFAQKQMELLREEKVQLVPVGGCLPMFLQIPIFFGLFSAIRFDYDLRHASFLWCSDLAVPDRLIALADPLRLECCLPTPPISIDGLNVLPLLMIAAMFVHQMGMPKSPDPQMQQQQKMMMFMPFFFGLMMYGYASGLSLYWLSSSVFGIFEQRVIKKIWPIT